METENYFPPIDGDDEPQPAASAENPTLFRLWSEALGFNKKQVSKAGKLIGHNNAKTSSMTATGARNLTMAEQLAMSAVRAGLEPWTPEYDEEITRQKQIIASDEALQGE